MKRFLSDSDTLYKEMSKDSDSVDLSELDPMMKPIVEYLVNNTIIITRNSCQGHPVTEDGNEVTSSYLMLTGDESHYLLVSKWVLLASHALRQIFEEPVIKLELDEAITYDEKSWYPCFTIRSTDFSNEEDRKVYHDTLLLTLKQVTA